MSDQPSADDADLEPIPVTAWPPGWYADPWTSGQYRYWNGDAWTADTHRAGPITAPATGGATPGSSPYARAPRPRGRRVAPIIAGVIVLVVLAGAIGYAIEASTENNSATTSTTQGPGRVAPVPGSADRAALENVGLRGSDVDADHGVVLIPQGNRTTQPTLDLCNGTFASERQRVARWQVAEFGRDQQTVMSTEAVTYRDAASTEAAFAELRKVRAACPPMPVKSPVGEPTVKTSFQPAPDQGWPQTKGVTRLAYRFTTTTAANGRTYSSIAVYLRRGRVLMGVYFSKPTGAQPPVAGATSVAGIVGVFEARLARLPASFVDPST